MTKRLLAFIRLKRAYCLRVSRDFKEHLECKVVWHTNAYRFEWTQHERWRSSVEIRSCRSHPRHFDPCLGRTCAGQTRTASAFKTAPPSSSKHDSRPSGRTGLKLKSSRYVHPRPPALLIARNFRNCDFVTRRPRASTGASSACANVRWVLIISATRYRRSRKYMFRRKLFVLCGFHSVCDTRTLR